MDKCKERERKLEAKIRILSDGDELECKKIYINTCDDRVDKSYRSIN